MVKTNNKGVYIRTIEAAMIWEHNNRGSSVMDNYTGYIPYSLELIKLHKVGLDEYVKRLVPLQDGGGSEVKDENGKVKQVTKRISTSEIDKRTLKNINRIYTDDVINVKFNSNVDNLKGIIRKIKDKYNRKIKVIKAKCEDVEVLAEEIRQLEEVRDNKIEGVTEKANGGWEEIISIDILRDMMYEDGFIFKNYKGEDVTYLPYKRSSAKARTGEILFIRKELLDVMSEWSRMGLEVPKDVEIDLAAWEAYLALVSSSIENTIKINPKNILLIEDVESVFEQEAISINKAVLVEKGESRSFGNMKITTGKQIGEKLFSLNGIGTIKNVLWDGQGLLDSSYYKGEYEDKSMMLLRQAFFKSCLFNTNIKQFMRDQFPDTYETATVEDMLGNKIKVEDIHCIITPSSLKIFKFSDLVGTDNKMYEHWQKVVKDEKCIFGICKSEYQSKRGSLGGMPLQQMSYQMINSLPLTEEQVTELSQIEVTYINDIKNDNDKFIHHLKVTAALTNSNQMIIDLYEHNSDFAKTDLFIEFKTNVISEYSKHIRKGKLRVVGDYCVLVGNCYEMLLHSVKKLDLHNLKSHTLQDNQVHTKLFEVGELAGFRNPHTSANNILHARNVHNELIDTYFNFTNNIVAVNAIEFAIQDILSSCDYDSDTMLVTNNSIIVEVAKNNEAKVCLNNVPATSNTYKLTALSRSKVDKAIASDIIGRIVNVGQAAQSIMYDSTDEKVKKKMKEITEIISVASCIAIDLAKKSYAVVIEKELERLDKIVKDNLKVNHATKKPSYPLFMSKKSKRTKYDTSMDHVFSKFKVSADNDGGIERAEEVKTIDRFEMMELVKTADSNNALFKIADANDKQENEIITLVEEYINNTKSLRVAIGNDENSDNFKKVLNKELASEALEFQKKMKKRNIKEVTIYAMLYHLFYKESIECSTIKVMNAIYLSNPNKFINIFIHKK